jgi:hypothetical protein
MADRAMSVVYPTYETGGRGRHDVDGAEQQALSGVTLLGVPWAPEAADVCLAPWLTPLAPCVEALI